MEINCKLDTLVNLAEDKAMISMNSAKNIARRILLERKRENSIAPENSHQYQKRSRSVVEFPFFSQQCHCGT